jgi:ribosomal protein L29
MAILRSQEIRKMKPDERRKQLSDLFAELLRKSRKIKGTSTDHCSNLHDH